MSVGAPWDHGVGQWSHTLMPCVCVSVWHLLVLRLVGRILRLGIPSGQGGLPHI